MTSTKMFYEGVKLLNSDGSLQSSTYDFPSMLNIITSNFFLYKLLPKNKYFNKYHLINNQINKIVGFDVVTGAFIFSSRNELVKLSGFDEDFFFYNEDTDLCYRYKLNCGKVIYFQKTEVIHHKGVATGSNTWFKYKNTSISTNKYYQKNFIRSYFLAIIINFIGSGIRVLIKFLISILTLNKKKFIDSIYHLHVQCSFSNNH